MCGKNINLQKVLTVSKQRYSASIEVDPSRILLFPHCWCQLQFIRPYIVSYKNLQKDGCSYPIPQNNNDAPLNNVCYSLSTLRSWLQTPHQTKNTISSPVVVYFPGLMASFRLSGVLITCQWYISFTEIENWNYINSIV